MRNILAATGKSGGISAEQILRQFNAKRFAEASKVWAAAESFMSADPLYFTPPAKAAAPGTPHHSAPNTAPSTAGVADCSGSGNAGAFCNADNSGDSWHENAGTNRGFQARSSSGNSGGGGSDGKARPVRVRTCGGGGWVC